MGSHHWTRITRSRVNLHQPVALLTPAASTEQDCNWVRTDGMRPIGTAEGLQRRRLRAVELVNQGESPGDVAHFLGCGRPSVYTWAKPAREDPSALAAKPHPGRTPRLGEADRKRLGELLLQGAKAHGWRTELWTAARVADLIERHFGIASHPEHARKVLRRKLGWTSQKPQRRAKERDEVAIAH